jgi:hypothetical protein
MSGKGWPERVANRAAATEEVTRAHCRQQTTKIPSGLAHFQIDPFESTLAKLCSLHLIAAIGILVERAILGTRSVRVEIIISLTLEFDSALNIASNHKYKQKLHAHAICT